MSIVAAPAPSSVVAVARTLRGWLLPLGIFVGFLVVWDILVRFLGLPQFILPAPSRIAQAWVTYLPELWASTTYTLVEIIAGLIIGSFAGILMGAVTARWLGLRE